MKENKKPPKQITAEELDEKIDKGEDISEYFDWDNATKLVNLSIPVWALKEIDKEASRRGVARQALLKHWIIDRIDEMKATTSHENRPQSKDAQTKKRAG